MPLPAPPIVPASVSSLTSCRVAFGSPATAIVRSGLDRWLTIALPVLAGEAQETILANAEPPLESNGCTLFHARNRVAGLAIADPSWEIEAAAQQLYARVFSAAQGRHLYRLWNYVPQINAVTENLETYRRFCRGRSQAFETHFGQSFQLQLPSASAVGVGCAPLAVAFIAGNEPARHFENPRQTPAFEYPPAYGPRSPSFSRATRIDSPNGTREIFISGTAAIRGHATIGGGDLHAQLECTFENLQIIAEAAGAGPEFGAAQGWHRTFKTYLRHAPDLPAVATFLNQRLLRPSDVTSYLEADLCRADLLVEIEAVLTREPRAGPAR